MLKKCLSFHLFSQNSIVNYPSKHLELAVEQLSKFPGIGKKSALRMALFLLKQEPQAIQTLGNAIINLKEQIRYCKTCHNISDAEVCNICSNPQRKHENLCVVSDFRDVLAIENTGLFHGGYHVLGGLISPMEGIGPDQLNINTLIQRLEVGNISEVIFALSPTVEGDTTTYYLQQKLKNFAINFSTIAKGVAIGGELEYADEITLGRSIVHRINLSL
jgi:recombination protein RecR